MCIVVLQVWDVTNYAPDHPVGATLVTMDCGKDGTEAFDGEHPRDYLERFVGIENKKGPLVGSPPEPEPTPAAPAQSPVSFQELSGHDNPGDCWVAYYDEVCRVVGLTWGD